MHTRRQVLSLTGLAATATLGGCMEDAAVNETVREDGQWRFDASEGDTITVEVENEQGYIAGVYMDDPDGNALLDEEVETEDEFDVEAPMDGTYYITVVGERVSITVTVD